MEQILIHGLQVFGHHGVYEHEKKEGQIFVVDATLSTSFDAAVATDDLSNTTDYGNVCLFIKKYFAEKAYDLIEKAADDLAEEMLLSFPGIAAVDLTIKKPDAPIPMEFLDVAVRTTKAWHTVAIGLGSNMGERESYLTSALEFLMADSKIRRVLVSDYIETEPYGYLEQDPFLNAAATFDTLYDPMELLAKLHEIENEAGRERMIHWGPRTLDLDILFYDDLTLNTKDLIIPHIDLCNRRFVLEPLAAIAPGLVHPIRRRTIYDLLDLLKEEEHA